MKGYILVDNDKIVRCIATEEASLHKDKLHMKKYHVETKGIVGDEYDEMTDEWTPHPENYPQLTKLQIEDEVASLVRQREGLKNIEKELGTDKTDEIDVIDDKIADWKDIYDGMEPTSNKTKENI